jgi:hypothetical protein
MNPINGQIAAPRFDTRNKREKDALTAWTIARLHQLDEDAQEGRHHDLLLTPEAHARREYAMAKSSARCGNLEPLRTILVSILGDPEIAKFIAEPHRPRGRRRRPYMTPTQSISRHLKNLAVVTVEQVRQIWRKQYRKWKRHDRLAEEIAAEYCELRVDEVEDALKREPRTRRPAK